MNLKAFFMPRVLRFVFISVIRLLSVVALCLVIGAEIQEMVRNIEGYASAVHEDKAPSSNSTHASLSNSTSTGFVGETSVPSHAGGIFFSTFFRFINVIVLLFLLVSEISPPLPAITNFYLRFFPPLSEEASLGFLGAAMMWIATSILSSDVQSFTLISAWILFIVGFLNVVLGLVCGSGIRESRAIFPTDKSTRDVLPTSTKTKTKINVSYPVPVDIGFPAPAASKSSLGLGGSGSFDVTPYTHTVHSRPSISEMVERRATSPTNGMAGIHRSRSGKGIVTIKTNADHEESLPHHQPPSYAHGSVV